MRFIFLSIKFLPYWSVPLTMIFGEMAYIFRRRGNKPQMYRMGLAALLFIALTALFFVYRWDVNLYPWIREQFGDQQTY